MSVHARLGDDDRTADAPAEHPDVHDLRLRHATVIDAASIGI